MPQLAALKRARDHAGGWSPAAGTSPSAIRNPGKKRDGGSACWGLNSKAHRAAMRRLANAGVSDLGRLDAARRRSAASDSRTSSTRSTGMAADRPVLGDAHRLQRHQRPTACPTGLSVMGPEAGLAMIEKVPDAAASSPANRRTRSRPTFPRPGDWCAITSAATANGCTRVTNRRSTCDGCAASPLSAQARRAPAWRRPSKKFCCRFARRRESS